MARVYLTGSGPTKGYATGSGIISNPVRILLQEKDNHTGSYPTIARTGDTDFSGKFVSYYDDTNTINFLANSSILYPTALPNVSKWVSGGVATPNILQGLSTVGSSSKGVADSLVSFTPGENISPFKEDRIYINNNSVFYQTGTATSIIPGFDQRLSSKTAIVIDANPVSSTNFFFSTGTLPNTTLGLAGGVNSGIGYFNWQTKKWEIIGNLSTGSNVDFVNSNPTVRFSSPYAFTSRCEFYPNASWLSPVNQTAAHVGVPHSTCGFPFASQFNATGSQLLNMTSSINSPFLIEKIIMEFSASFPAFEDAYARSQGISSFLEGPNVYQFFLLNVRNQNINATVGIVQDLTGTVSGTSKPTQRTTNYTVTQYKDLIWTGEISRFDNKTAQDSQWYRDLNISGTLGVGGITAVTGAYAVAAAPRVFGVSDGLLTAPVRTYDANPDSKVPLMSNKLGGRNFAGISEGRSFIRSVVGTASSGTLYLDDGGSTNLFVYAVPLIAQVKFESPYVLMPGDNLVLGFANQSIISGGPTSTTYVSYTEQKIKEQVVTLSPGLGKLTLFGSLLRNNLPVDFELNQPLTSDAIHEDIHYDNPVFDQFDTDSYYALSGSYVDLIITGSMLATPIGSPIAPNVRKVQASAAAGQAGTTGSLQRFVNLTSESDLYYDSLAPNPLEITLANGFTTWNAAPNFTIEQGVVGGGQDSRADQKWLRSFPFAPEYLNFKRGLTFSKPQLGQFGVTDPVRGVAELTYVGGDFIRKVEFSPFVSYDNRTQASESSIYRQFYGIGDGLGGRPTLINLVDTTLGFGSNIIYAGNLVLRGFKYGLLNATRENSKSRFRRDRYGQFRDMLEQSPNAAYLVNNSVEYPLEVKFFSRPGKDGKGRQIVRDAASTHSQNLSTFATSSLPFFDGVARDRNDDPDVTLESVTLTSLVT